jgi:hypothetical protein
LTKKNENINLFVIEKEYERLKKNQNCQEDFSGRAIVSELNQSDIKKLLEMHQTFAAIKESNEQVDNLRIDESPDTSDVLDIVSSFQEINTKEQELLEVKQRLLETQQELHSKLVKEIENKKIAVNNLTSEIENLQNICKQLYQALDIPSSYRL